MSEKRTGHDLQNAIAQRLKEFRTEEMKRWHLSDEQFASQCDIPLQTIQAYETGDLTPSFEDLNKLIETFGLSLNWLLDDNGGMYLCREKVMEELVQFIEEDKHEALAHYKMLLKSMQNPIMEKFIFLVHSVTVDLVSTVNLKIEDSPDNLKLMDEIIKDVAYPPFKQFEALYPLCFNGRLK
jgi:transcriptional regulator with XRE-family HTH domain